VNDGKKTCTNCGKEKPLDDFPSWIEKKTGLRKYPSWCGKCKMEFKSEWQKRPHAKAYMRKYHQDHKLPERPEQRTRRLAAIRKSVADAIAEIRRMIMRRDGLFRCCQCKGIYGPDDRRGSFSDGYRCRPCYKRHKDRNRARLRVISSKRSHRRRTHGIENPGTHISKALRARHRMAMRAQGLPAKNCRTRETMLFGCNTKDVATYIESLWSQGMTWKNYGRVRQTKTWEIDHIVPLCKFDLSQEDQRRRAFHYTNLRPLWGHINRKLGGRAKRIAVQLSLLMPTGSPVA